MYRNQLYLLDKRNQIRKVNKFFIAWRDNANINLPKYDSHPENTDWFLVKNYNDLHIDKILSDICNSKLERDQVSQG